MVILRVFGVILAVLGGIFCLTIIGAFIGFPMIIVGLLMVLVGKKRAPIVVQIQQNHGPSTTN